MSTVTPQFLRVTPDDIGRVGPMGACILALVRYVTSLPGETNGRRLADGSMWWRASHNEIGESLGGVPHDTVRRTLAKLAKSGDLLSIPTQEFFGDRAHAYRACDQPLRESASGSDQPLRESASPLTQKCVSTSRESASRGDAKVRDVPISEELEEEGRSARRDEREPTAPETVPVPGDAPPRFCPKHDENYRGACIPCRDARRVLEEWEIAADARADDERRRRRELRANCQICHGTNLVDVGNDHARKCDHGIGEKTA